MSWNNEKKINKRNFMTIERHFVHLKIEGAENDENLLKECKKGILELYYLFMSHSVKGKH